MPSTTLPPFMDAAIKALQAGDIDGWMEMYAADAVHEFPFAPKDSVQRLQGRDEIAAYMAKLPAMIHFGTLSDVRVREANGEVIMEAVGHHRRIRDKTACELSYVWFVTHATARSCVSATI